MFCTYCGKEIPDNSMFCPNCGRELSKADNKDVSTKESGLHDDTNGTPTNIQDHVEKVITKYNKKNNGIGLKIFVLAAATMLVVAILVVIALTNRPKPLETELANSDIEAGIESNPSEQTSNMNKDQVAEAEDQELNAVVSIVQDENEDVSDEQQVDIYNNEDISAELIDDEIGYAFSGTYIGNLNAQIFDSSREMVVIFEKADQKTDSDPIARVEMPATDETEYFSDNLFESDSKNLNDREYDFVLRSLNDNYQIFFGFYNDEAVDYLAVNNNGELLLVATLYKEKD